MSKDFAMLFVIDKWLVATKEMHADCRGWYLNLILHQYDKGDLPSDIEELANLADVRFSEFEKFKQVFQQVLQQKFNKKDNGRLVNPFADQILKDRETFKGKRSEAGKMSSILKKARAISTDDEFLRRVKVGFDINTNSTNVQQVLQHMFQLYNRDRNIDEDIVEDKDRKESVKEREGIIYPFNTDAFKMNWLAWRTLLRDKHDKDYFNLTAEQSGLMGLSKLAKTETEAIEILQQSLRNGWKDLFKLKTENGTGKQATDYGKLKADSVERMAAIVRAKHGNGNQQPVEGDSGAS